MTHVSCESKLHLVVRLIHAPGNWVAIGCTVVYYDRSAHAFSAGIKNLFCRSNCC